MSASARSMLLIAAVVAGISVREGTSVRIVGRARPRGGTRRRRAVPEPAFVAGDSGSKSCPAGSYPIQDMETCKLAIQQVFGTPKTWTDGVNEHGHYNAMELMNTWHLPPGCSVLSADPSLAKRVLLAKEPPMAWDPMHRANDAVVCPFSGQPCARNECCPGVEASGNKTFPCPSAESVWDAPSAESVWDAPSAESVWDATLCESEAGASADLGLFTMVCQTEAAIICPVLAAGVRHGKMVPNADGAVAFTELHAFLTSLGTRALAAHVANSPMVNPLLNVYNMNGHPELEHGLSSGIRDPVRNRSNMDILLSYASADRTFTERELTAAGTYFDGQANAESHHVAMCGDRPCQPVGVELSFTGLLLPVFGRCGPDNRTTMPLAGGDTFTSHYPSKRCARTGGVMHMRSDDMESIMWNSRFPEDFEFF